MRSTKNEKPHKRPQPLIASFFGGGPPKPARKPMITTPEKVVLNRCNSRLSVVTSSKSAFDEFGSSDTSFGSPEVQNFKNPVLSKWSKSASENGLPERSRPKTNMKEELLDALGLNDKENVVPTNYVVLKEEQLIDMHASTIKKEAIASLSQFQVKKEASSDTPNTEETVTPLIKELEELNRANPTPKKQVKIEELKVVNNDFVTDRTLDTKHNKETVAKPKLSPIKKVSLKRSGSSSLDFFNTTFKKPTRRLPPSQSIATPASPSRVTNKQEFNEAQRAIINYVVNKEESVFFTGSAGTGKSYVLRYLVQQLVKKHGGPSVGVTASTGMAAINIGGETLHKYLHIGLGVQSPEAMAKKLERIREVKNKWDKLKVLIIDEILMIDGKLFTNISELASIMKKNKKPFGGIQLVCSGDFFQLPPVSRDNRGHFCFQSPVWASVIKRTITLTEIFRQKGDTELIDMLNALRQGEISDDIMMKFKLLLRRINYSDGIEPTELYPTRQEVKRANESRLHELPGQVYSFFAIDSQVPQLIRYLYDYLMCEKVLELKVGAQVMCLKNNIIPKVVNGSIGTVVGFVTDPVWTKLKLVYGYVNFENASSELLSLIQLVCGMVGRPEYTDEQRAIYASLPSNLRTDFAKVAAEAKNVDSKAERLPLVKFRTSNGYTIDIVPRVEFTVEPKPMQLRKDDKMTRIQIPLTLAWAMSIHKSQGQSIDRLRIDLRRTFEKGQVYVALSRATCKEHLEVFNFDRRKISVSEEVKKFYDLLKNRQKGILEVNAELMS